MRHDSANAVFTPASTALRFSLGSEPGMAESRSVTDEFIGRLKLFSAPEKSLRLEAI